MIHTLKRQNWSDWLRFTRELLVVRKFCNENTCGLTSPFVEVKLRSRKKPVEVFVLWKLWRSYPFIFYVVTEIKGFVGLIVTLPSFAYFIRLAFKEMEVIEIRESQEGSNHEIRS